MGEALMRRSSETDDPDRLTLERTALFLDLDGTLTALRDRPSDVRPHARRTALLREAGARLAGRVAIISGRTVANIDQILQGACLAVSGVHGLQRRSACGDYESVEAHTRIDAAAALMTSLCESHAGLVLEHKQQSVALHYRRAPKAEAAIVEFVERLGRTEALLVQRGDKVIELRTPGPDKGAAVRRFLGEAPFRGATPIYIGDDLTDESAFQAVCSAGGLGVVVGGRRPTAALAALPDPAAVRAWIRNAVQLGRFDLRRLQWVA